MSEKKLLTTALKYINKQNLSNQEVDNLKNIICYLSEYKLDNPNYKNQFPQMDLVLYNASIKLRTFGYNRLNNYTLEEINKNDNLSNLRDLLIAKLYESDSGYTLDKYQKEFLDEYEEFGNKIFLSAPTSFGKTFLLKEIILKHNVEYKNIVIVLPTIALLLEVSEEINWFNSKNCLNYSIYNSIYKDLEISDKNIFILTPERVLRLFVVIPNLKIDFFFFDEIYKIDEDVSISSEDVTNQSTEKDRSVAFRIALYYLLKKVNNCYLAGPYIKLNKLDDGFKLLLKKHNIHPKEIIFSPTLKKTFFFENKKLKINFPIDDVIDNTPIIFNNAKTKIDKLIDISNYLQFSESNQAIIYCLYPAYAEQYAAKFLEAQNIPIHDSDTELNDFIDHLKNNFNFKLQNNIETANNWDLINSLKHQIGIHYGKFPKYIQREIINLFNNKKLTVLFCTSTIVEGVNTNAKTVVVFNTPISKSLPGKQFLLLNINGRAGRYMHHFIGNIVYLDNKAINLSQYDGIGLDFKPYNPSLELSNLDLENILDEDLSNQNLIKKSKLNLEKELLPDKIFEQNRLIERKKQEAILKDILKNINMFNGIESATIATFIDYFFPIIVSIWGTANNMSEKQTIAIKSLAIGYSKRNYASVLEYQFGKISSNDKNIRKSINNAYRNAFNKVKDIIEYQIPRILSLFESLLNHAYYMEGIKIESELNFSEFIRYFEIGAISKLGIDMVEKSVPIITIKKIDPLVDKNLDLDSQKSSLQNIINNNKNKFDNYEMKYITRYIELYCK